MDIRLVLSTGDHTTCMYERRHSISIRAKYLLFLRAFDKEIQDCIFELVGWKEISIVHVRDMIFSARVFTAGHYHRLRVLRRTPDDTNWRSSSRDARFLRTGSVGRCDECWLP